MGSSKAAARRDLAADTVIGFVLVTGISLLMISVVMLVGAPALEQVQSRQQMDSMVASYQRLDRGVSTLLSGAPAGTTPSWQVSMADGSLSLDDGGEHVWGYVINKKIDGNEYRFWFGGYSDGDNELTLRYEGSNSIQDADFEIQAIRWEAGEDVEEWEDPAEPTVTTNDEYTFGVTSSSADLWNIAEHTTQIRLLDTSNDDGEQLVAEAWFIDGGAVEWKLTTGGSMKRLLYQNTGIIADIDDGHVLHNSPRLRTPDHSGDQMEVFVRVVSIDGAVAVGGRSTSEMLLSSQGNHDRFSSAMVTHVQLYPPTSLIPAWERHLTNEAAGFDYQWRDTSPLVGDEGVAHRGPPTGDEVFTTSLVETDLVMKRSGGG